jgi:SAM-dependent methyltransferase
MQSAEPGAAGSTPPTIKGLEGLAANHHFGPRLARLVADLCELRPDDRILDVGSGIGRVAQPLTEYIGPNGAYEGLDIVNEAVTWCTEHITTAHPNFRFRHAPVHNDRYNPTGTVRDQEFVFPYDDASFDVVVLTSVFTHMLPAGVAQYLGQIARVLHPGGRALITMFLLNPESDALRTRPASLFSFSHDRGNYAIQVPNPPEAAVAFREDFVRGLFAAHGLVPQIHYGSWCGRADHLDLQDVLVASRA